VFCEQSRCAGLGISERRGAETTTTFQVASLQTGPDDQVRRDGGIFRRSSDSPGWVPRSQTLGSSQECSLPSQGVIHSIVTPPGALLECQ
jgi:hypothetical protein